MEVKDSFPSADFTPLSQSAVFDIGGIREKSSGKKS
jgi:hypothetical protein